MDPQGPYAFVQMRRHLTPAVDSAPLVSCLRMYMEMYVHVYIDMLMHMYTFIVSTYLYNTEDRQGAAKAVRSSSSVEKMVFGKLDD